MGQTIYKTDWQHFTLRDFLELRWRLLHDYDAVLPGGEYFGQVRCGDLCYDIQIEWLASDGGQPAPEDSETPELELFVTMSPFFPHAKDETAPPYDELVPGMPYDTQKGGSLICARRDFLQMGYEYFQQRAGQGIVQKIATFPRLRREASKLTGFWDRHDAILCRLHQQQEKKEEKEEDTRE